MVFAVYPTVANEVVRYLEDGTLADALGAGPTLTVPAGTERWADILPGVQAFAFDEATRIGGTTYAPLQLADAVTVECIFRSFENNASADQWTLVVHEASGETSGANTLWGLKLLRNYSSSEPVNTLAWMHEYGSGTNALLSATGHALEPTGVYHVVGRRAAASGGNAAVDLWVNGVQVASGSLTQASGGTTSTVMRIGGNPDGATAANLSGAIGFVRVCSRALTDAEIVAAYNATLGGVFGTRKVAP